MADVLNGGAVVHIRASGSTSRRSSLPEPVSCDVSPPVLLNIWKHHAGALRLRIAEAVAAGEPGLRALADQLVVIGTELMDLYTGTFTPAEIAGKVLAALRAADRLAPDAYRAWVAEGGGYQTLTFPEDGSVWVLRAGDDTRYVHVHPGRRTPHTRRVRANVLKTAVLVLACAGVRGGDPRDVAFLNAVRREFLGLSPVGRKLSGAEGLGAVNALLASGACERPVGERGV